jgi:hypothetical protein
MASIAVFLVLGGTGFAAARSTDGARDKAGQPLTKNQVNKLIAKYVNAHKKQLTGPQGPPGKEGSAGARGGTGPAGPGAIRISANGSSSVGGSQTAGTVGPWTIALTCTGSNATMKITGPGTVGGTTSLAAGGGAATTYVGSPGEIGTGVTSVVNVGGQMSQDLFLQSGSTVYELRTLMTASSGGLFTDCTLVGDAIPIA